MPPYPTLALTCALLASPAWGADAPAAAGAGIPDTLMPPANQTLSLQVNGDGVQIYVCGPAKAQPGKLEWTLKAPQAELVDAAGKRIGRHYAGPTWEADDGSKVVGEVVAHEDAPDPGAITWLLLRAKATSGRGILSRTTMIQRLRTVGGKAPAGGCSQAGDAGKEVRIAYRAVYTFYTGRP